MYTTASAFLDALLDAGVEYLFVNLGSDHTALIEAIGQARESRRRAPKLITCPHESVALSAAHGYAQLTGQAQAVIVHVECGTQSLAGAVHNASRGRVPVLIFAGTSPATQEGEARGSRNEFIHWLQDSFDQRSLVRGYVRYEHEVRVGANVKQIVLRAMQIAHSDPQGPVYLTMCREVLEQEIEDNAVDADRWLPIGPCGLPSHAPDLIAQALATARRPLIITSYLGRNRAAVGELVKLCDRLGVAVLESAPSYLSFPHDHPLYLGSQWNEQRQHPLLAEADVLLVIDSDVPWIPLVNRPAATAHIIHLDLDPLKQQMPLWYIGAQHTFRVDSCTALRQISECVERLSLDESAVAQRRKYYEHRHAEREAELRKREAAADSIITPAYLTACVARAIGPDAVVVSEAVTNYRVVSDHSGRTKPGTLFSSGGGSLGWNGGAAIGAKLAKPDALVVSLTGDGTYMFSIPSSVHWMARRYGTPFLQVVYNNGGWRAPRSSAVAVHPSGFASRDTDIGTSFEPAPDYSGIAAAAGEAHAERVVNREELPGALQRAVLAIRNERRCAVVDVQVGSG
jgi:acetolactate synthase-1/2/3 large subunit